MPTLAGSRIANATRTWQAAADADVTGWDIANDFIVAMAVKANASKATPSMSLTIRWRNETDNPAGAFTALAATGELTWVATTNLLNNDPVTSGEAGAGGTGTWENGVEREGANAITDTIAAGGLTEHQWAVDCGSAHQGDQYTFELYDATSATSIGTCLAQITTAAGSMQYQRSVADDVGITDSTSTAIGYVKSLSNSVGISDLITASVGYFKTIANTVGITDAVGSVVGKIVSIVNSVGITDTISRAIDYVKSLGNNVGITDTFGRAIGYVKSLSNNVGISDTIASIVGKVVALADAVGIADVIGIVLGIVRTDTETVGITDAVDAVVTVGGGGGGVVYYWATLFTRRIVP